MTCGLYYKPMMIVNDDSRIVNKLEASLTDDARVVIYDRRVFIVQAIECKMACSKHYNPFFAKLQKKTIFLNI